LLVAELDHYSDLSAAMEWLKWNELVGYGELAWSLVGFTELGLSSPYNSWLRRHLRVFILSISKINEFDILVDQRNDLLER
jgi:hypothetical protein